MSDEHVVKSNRSKPLGPVEYPSYPWRPLDAQQSEEAPSSRDPAFRGERPAHSMPGILRKTWLHSAAVMYPGGAGEQFTPIRSNQDTGSI